jgi:hypothetical protein
MAAIPTKVDSRGRVSLGKAFANRLVLMTRLGEDRVEIEMAEAVPVREAWLHKNRAALESVARGLEQTGRGKFAQAPNVKAGSALADQIKDD